MLGFDVPTFVFQIINFLILLAILTRFFYRPVLKLMQERQAQIDARIQDAEARAKEAGDERRKLAQQSEVARREADTVIESARREAALERQHTIEQARSEAAAILQEARNSAAAEERAAIERLTRRLSDSATTIAGGLIRNVAGEKVHNEMLHRLSVELEQRKGSLDEATASLTGPLPAVLETAYPLTDSQLMDLRNQVAAALEREPGALPIEVRETPEILAGARLTLGALVVDMSLKHVLEELAREGGG
jgi:F-type H+-transporting ATPase subunit b